MDARGICCPQERYCKAVVVLSVWTSRGLDGLAGEDLAKHYRAHTEK
jgi:hypothetical protein